MCLVQPSSEKLSPVADGNEYRDPQMGKVQRVRDLGILYPTKYVFINMLPLWLRKSCIRRGKKIVRAIVGGVHQGNRAFYTTGLIHI